MQLPCQFHIIQNAILNTSSSNNQDPIHDQLKPPNLPSDQTQAQRQVASKHIRTSSFLIQIEAFINEAFQDRQNLPRYQNRRTRAYGNSLWNEDKISIKILQGAIRLEDASYATVVSTKEIEGRREEHDNKFTLAMAQFREQNWSGSRRAWEWNATGRGTVTGKTDTLGGAASIDKATENSIKFAEKFAKIRCPGFRKDCEACTTENIICFPVFRFFDLWMMSWVDEECDNRCRRGGVKEVAGRVHVSYLSYSPPADAIAIARGFLQIF